MGRLLLMKTSYTGRVNDETAYCVICAGLLKCQLAAHTALEQVGAL